MNLNKLLFFSKIFVGILISLFITAQIVIATYDINKYKNYIIQAIESKTGHGFSINNDFKISLSPLPVLIIDGIELKNSSWGTHPVMFSAKRIEIKPALLPLINKNLTINKLTIIEPEILVEIHNENKLNWLFNKTKAITSHNENNTPAQNNTLKEINIKNKKNEQNNNRKYNLKEIEVKNATIVFNEIASSKSIKFTRSYATISMDNIHSPITFIFGGNYNKRRFNLDGKIDSPISLIGNKKTSFNTNIAISHINTNLSGYIEKPMSLKGLHLKLMSELDTLRSLDRILGYRFPHTGPNYLNMTISNKFDNYIIDDFNIIIGDKEISGEVQVSLYEYKPSVYAKLHTEYFNLTPYINEKNIEEVVSFNSDLISYIHNIDVSLKINKLKINNQIDNSVIYKIELHDSSVSMKKESKQ